MSVDTRLTARVPSGLVPNFSATPLTWEMASNSTSASIGLGWERA